MKEVEFCLNCGYSPIDGLCPRCGFDNQSRQFFRQEMLITLIFTTTEDNKKEELVKKAKQYPGYYFQQSEEGTVTHSVIFPLSQLNNVAGFLEKVEADPTFEILFNGKQKPFAKSLWLPLLKILQTS